MVASQVLGLNDSRHRAAGPQQTTTLFFQGQGPGLSVPPHVRPCPDTHAAGHQQMNDKKDNSPTPTGRADGLLDFVPTKQNIPVNSQVVATTGQSSSVMRQANQ